MAALNPGWRSFDMALASIWRIRSRERSKCAPTSIEGAGLPAVEAEAQGQDFALAGRERHQQFGDLAG